MGTRSLLTKFSRIGAAQGGRRTVAPQSRRRGRHQPGREGRPRRRILRSRPRPDQETDASVAVLDVQPADRHLLLLVREGDEKQKFLCGHDERHWFVAAIPESAPVGTVRQAKEALKPADVQMAQSREGLRAKARDRRKNAAYRRQGEWFFLPVPDIRLDERFVLRNEALRRGDGGKPHWVEFCYRTGGESVYVCSHRPKGLTRTEYERLLASNPRAKAWGWQAMRRNAGVYVRGESPARRSQDDRASGVAPGADEYRGRVASSEKRRIPGLTSSVPRTKPVAGLFRRGLFRLDRGAKSVDRGQRGPEYAAACSGAAISGESLGSGTGRETDSPSGTTPAHTSSA